MTQRIGLERLSLDRDSGFLLPNVLPSADQAIDHDYQGRNKLNQHDLVRLFGVLASRKGRRVLTLSLAAPGSDKGACAPSLWHGGLVDLRLQGEKANTYNSLLIEVQRYGTNESKSPDLKLYAAGPDPEKTKFDNYDRRVAAVADGGTGELLFADQWAVNMWATRAREIMEGAERTLSSGDRASTEFAVAKGTLMRVGHNIHTIREYGANLHGLGLSKFV